ncbi:MAG TPA: protein tyrosine phosphatase [Opitutaceae bacterium]|nr:protein tyrosine phosphatase [Opitutaceae bacterium]
MPDPRLRVLFVCAMNKQRSVTAERLYCDDARLDVRSAGVRSEAKRRVGEADLKWADVVFVMEREHKRWITTRFSGIDLPLIDVLDVPDDFGVMDPELQKILRSLLDAEIAHLLEHRPLRVKADSTSRDETDGDELGGV